MKRLVFCFDGTWNKLDAPCPTNVVLTAESVLPLGDDNTAQLIFYDDGVGTSKGELVRGGMFGYGLVKNLADAYRFLTFNHTPGDQIYIFGFSRGAYAARSFGGLLRNCGILLRSRAAKAEEAINLYRARVDTPEYVERAMKFRMENSPGICVSQVEDDWRAKNVSGYTPGQAPRLSIAYVGVWDTVGALGIPSRFGVSRWINRKHQFHDTNLTSMVQSGRHAVAIDERRKDFVPSLWSNLDELNQSAATPSDHSDARYQQVWFPGTHSSVGGGGDRRGLSDQALHWIWDGAMRMGLQLDTDEHSRIFELAPNYAEFLQDTANPTFFYRVMNWFPADRLPGPAHLYEVSTSAKRRWLEEGQNLGDKKQYRPGSLLGLREQLDAMKGYELGVGGQFRDSLKKEEYKMYRVKRGDGLRAIAKYFYGKPDDYVRIVQANRDFIDDPNRIDVGQVLRIPSSGMLTGV